MTRVDFHFGVDDCLPYTCRLLRKVRAAGRQAVVCSDDPAQLGALDRLLWTFEPLEFLPHVMAGDPLAADTPIVLGAPDADVPHYDVLVNLGRDVPRGFASFERLIEIVDHDESRRSAARERYRTYRSRGYPLETHEVSGGAVR